MAKDQSQNPKKINQVSNTQIRKTLNDVIQVLLLSLIRCLQFLKSPIINFIRVFAGFKRVFNVCVYVVRAHFYAFIGWLQQPSQFDIQGAFRKNQILIKNWHFGVGIFVIVGVLSKFLIWLCELFDEKAKMRKALLLKMAKATSYEEWRDIVLQHEKLSKSKPKQQILFDQHLLARKVEHLRAVRESCQEGNIEQIMFNLRQDLVRNLGNMSNTELYGQRFGVVPDSIREYINEVQKHLQLMTESESVPLQERLSFLQETRHAFGRSALLLSGGGGLGVFHLGVVKALFQQGLLPRVVAGSSVGSIVAAIICTLTDEELTATLLNMQSLNLSFFNNSTTSEFLSHLISKGTLQDIEFLVNRLRTTLGDLTFQEAYERTGRILNVTVCAVDTKEPPRLLNYLTAPHALIWSAVAASSAFPGLFPAQELLARDVRTGKIVKLGEFYTGARRWRDGSLESDLPIRGLSELFNVNYCIVSQTNPHIVPLMALKRMVPWKWLAQTIENEFRHRCLQMQMSFGGKWLTLFTQPWEGDVTMFLPMRYYRLNKLITNPTYQELLEATQQGEQQTWAKMAAIHASCSIERTLDRCVYKLSKEMKKTLVQTSLKTRIPSWINLRKNVSTDSLNDATFDFGAPKMLQAKINLFDVMLPLASSSVALNQLSGQRSVDNFGLDVIAP